MKHLKSYDEKVNEGIFGFGKKKKDKDKFKGLSSKEIEELQNIHNEYEEMKKRLGLKTEVDVVKCLLKYGEKRETKDEEILKIASKSHPDSVHYILHNKNDKNE
jgi:hypothetical protein